MYIILLSLLIIIVIITSWTYKLYQQTVICLAKKTCLLSKSQLQLLPNLNHITWLYKYDFSMILQVQMYQIWTFYLC